MSESNEVLNRAFDQIAGTIRVTHSPATAITIIDEALAPTTTYIGKAAAGTSQAAAKGWLITRITESGTTTTIDHAVDAWSNRASATYS